MSETTNIYGQITSLDELRELYRQLGDEVTKAESREDLNEIKERSEYLCILADNPIWRDEFDGGGERAIDLCMQEDTRLTSLLNDRVGVLGIGGETYHRWREGDDSTAKSTR